MTMTKEYLAEIRQLEKARSKQRMAYNADIRQLTTKRNRLTRDISRAEKLRDKTCERITRRIAVLEGRL